MKYLFNFLNLACLTAAMFISVDIFYKYLDSLVTDPDIGREVRSSNGSTKADRGDRGGSGKSTNGALSLPLSHYEVIHKRDIFNTEAAPVGAEKGNGGSEKSEIDRDSIQKTALKLKLWGTVTGNSEQESYAVIENDRDKRQALYRTGDEIEDALIKKIIRQGVILTREGREELLEMEEDKSETGGKGPATAQKQSVSKQGESDDKIEISLERSVIEESMSDVNSLMSQVRAKPHFTGGNADGILLYGMKQSSLFREMGIQNGDIIMGVDGSEIRSVEDALSLYDRLRNAQDLKMQIRRRGQLKEILYHVE